MWIPYEDAVVVVTNDPENELPLAGPGTETRDANGGRKKVVTGLYNPRVTHFSTDCLICGLQKMMISSPSIRAVSNWPR